MPPTSDVRSVLRIRAFRQLWIALSLSSLGDWLGLLATTALASELAGTYSGKSFAIGGVLIVRLAPAVLLGPIAGAFADRFDRRRTMVVCDVIRGTLFASIPLFHSLPYLYAASFLIESVSLFWIPAKEASVPNLVPKRQLEAANQLSLITTYGSAPIASAAFALLAVVNNVLASAVSFFSSNPVDLALYFDAATFLFSAVTVFRLREISHARTARGPADRGASTPLWRSITAGWEFVGQTPMVRGLVIGMLGAFAAGGAIIATGRLYVSNLNGGDAAYGVLFGAVFLGLAGGMFFGPRLLGDFSRKRLCGLAIVAAGGSLMVMSVLPNLVLAIFGTVSVGAFAGIAWVTGYTLVGLEVDDTMRGRTFAFVQSLVRIDLLLVLAFVPFLVGIIGKHSVRVGRLDVRLDGVTIVLFVAGIVAAAVGLIAFHQMDDRRGVPLLADLLGSIRGRPAYAPRPPSGGLFVAVEGGEGAGKSTQVQLLAQWLRARGRQVVVTREPGDTPAGARIRDLLLDPAAAGLSPRSEALLYAADRAEHVARVIRPALDRGADVVTDRYVDSSLAYQGAGRALPAEEVDRLSRWATEGLVPELTVLLDVPPEVGLRRIPGVADRIERESVDFHARVRRGFRELADRDPGRYLVIDARARPDRVHAEVCRRLEAVLSARAEKQNYDQPTEPVPAVTTDALRGAGT